jgi:hypothetical protein
MKLAFSPPNDLAVAEGDRPAHLPPLVTDGGELVPKAPTGLRDAGISPATICDQALKAA